MNELHDIAVDLESQIFKERWLVVKCILNDLPLYERIKVIRTIEDESTRVSQPDLDKAMDLAISEDLETLEPL